MKNKKNRTQDEIDNDNKNIEFEIKCANEMREKNRSAIKV